jgi:type IV secretion system protein VirB10
MVAVHPVELDRAAAVKADVNSHFFERFSGAILQSALDVGVNLASRSANGSVFVALPNSSAGARQ